MDTENSQSLPDDVYEELYIAFLDLLGFKAQVEEAERDPAAHERLRLVLQLMHESLCAVPRIKFGLNYFSDCIVLSGARTAECLLEMFNSICLLTSNLMQHDVLIRGGIAAGPVHRSRDFLYGSAYNRAYLLEHKKAVAPIVMLSEEVIEDAKNYKDPHMLFLMERQGRTFVNFLLQYALYRAEPRYAGKIILERPGARVINFIQQRLNKHEGSVRDKAEWIRGYWNDTVSIHGVFGTIEEGAPEKSDLGGPTIAIRRLYNFPPRS